jgi:polyhydroxyalkanoate synthesis regulator phasin
MSDRDAEHPAGNPADLARQLREAADRLMSGWTAAPPVRPAMPAMPASLSTRQVQAVLDDLAARRAQVQTLRSQLEAFDEQLGALEANLRPVLEWTRVWSDVENAVSRFWGLSAGDR